MAQRLASIELGLASYHPIPHTVAWAQEAARWGIRRFWLAENYYFRSVIPIATAVCLGTRSIGVGLGLLNWFTRLAPLIAMETATLDEVSGGRLTLGIGAGRTPATHLGIDQSRTIRGLRESLDVTRRLLAGDALGYAGMVYGIAPVSVRLGFRAPRGASVPIYLAGMGPSTLRLAAQVSDGVFLDVFTTPGFVRSMHEHVATGLRQSGRTLDDIFYGTYAVFAVDRNRRAARDLLKS